MPGMTSTEAVTARPTIRIVIVDDHPLVRQGLDMLIREQTGWEVCGHAENMMDAIRLVNDTQPDLVLVDVSLKDGSGIELIKEVKARNPDARMLVLSNHDESLYAERALRAGAAGYVNKLEAGERLVQAMRDVLDGRIVLSHEMTERMLTRAIGGTADEQTTSPMDALSDRELEVFELIGSGLTTRQIAAKLFLSPKTVETYRENIKAKLGLHNSTQLVRHAVRWVLERT